MAENDNVCLEVRARNEHTVAYYKKIVQCLLYFQKNSGFHDIRFYFYLIYAHNKSRGFPSPILTKITNV